MVVPFVPVSWIVCPEIVEAQRLPEISKTVYKLPKLGLEQLREGKLHHLPKTVCTISYRGTSYENSP